MLQACFRIFINELFYCRLDDVESILESRVLFHNLIVLLRQNILMSPEDGDVHMDLMEYLYPSGNADNAFDYLIAVDTFEVGDLDAAMDNLVRQ